MVVANTPNSKSTITGFASPSISLHRLVKISVMCSFSNHIFHRRGVLFNFTFRGVVSMVLVFFVTP
jgi:hypothetical protein